MAAVPETIDLHLNYPLTGTEAEVMGNYLRGLDGGAAQYALTARPASGAVEDRSAVAKYLRDCCGVAAPVERVALVSGGHNGISAAIEIAGLQGSRIATDEVTYSNMIGLARRYGVTLLPCRGDCDGMLPQALGSAITQGASAVYLMPTVHNPLGTVMPLERRRELATVIEAAGLTVLEDEAYAFLEAAPPPAFASLLPEQTFHVYGFSKPFAPVLKLASLVTPQRFADAVEEYAVLSMDGISFLLAGLLRALIESGTLHGLVEAKRTEGAVRQRMARDLLRHSNVLPAQPNSYHLWVEPQRTSADDLVAAAAQRGVLLGSPRNFTVPGVTPPNAFRVALGGEADRQRARRGVEIVAELLEG